MADGILQKVVIKDLFKKTWGEHMYLPAFVFHAIVRVLLTDELVDSTERLFPVFGREKCLHNQLGIGIRRLGVFL